MILPTDKFLTKAVFRPVEHLNLYKQKGVLMEKVKYFFKQIFKQIFRFFLMPFSIIYVLIKIRKHEPL